MLQPIQRGEALLRDLRRETAEDQLHIWRFGPTGFVLRFRDAFLGLDLQLSRGIVNLAPGFPPIVDPEDLGMVPSVLATQVGPGRFQPETVLALKRATAGDLRLVVPRGVRSEVVTMLKSDPPEILPLDDGGFLSLGPFDVTGIAMHTEAGDEVGPGGPRMLGYAITVDGFHIFHCSQTIWYIGLTTRLQKLGSFDIMLLPVGQDPGPARKADNLTGHEAASLAKMCCRGIVIPHHFDESSEFLTAPAGFEESCSRLGQDYEILRPGEKLSVERTTFAGH